MTEETKPPQPLRIVPAKGGGDLACALAIREVVFIEEQRVPESLERDEEDGRAFHVLAYDGGHAVGTGRLVLLSAPPEGEQGRWGRIGRMAVLAAFRGRGAGRSILEALEAEAARRGLDGVLLSRRRETVTRQTRLPRSSEMIARITNTTNSTHAMLVAAPAMPLKPSTAAIRAMTKKMMA